MTQCSGWQSPGWSNPNLLVNWDFRNPVNQRGQKSYAQNGYTIDMLKSDSYLVHVDVEDGYIRITNGLGYNYVIGFAIENTSALIGQNITFSMKKESGEIVISTVKPYLGGIVYFGRFAGIEEGMIKISVPTGGILDIQAVKLEVGSISTLSLDLMQPSDYAAELRKCQRYLQKHSYRTRYSGSANSTGKGVDISVALAVPMRKTPTILDFIPNFYRFHGNNYNPANPIIAATNMETDVNEINIAIVDEGVFTSEARNPVSVGASKDFLLSAEL